MARTKKSFKDKEKAFLEKQKSNTTSVSEVAERVVLKTASEQAYEELLKNGFNVSFQNTTLLYCQCKDTEEYERYREFLVKNYGHDGKVPFSFGASIGKAIAVNF